MRQKRHTDKQRTEKCTYTLIQDYKADLGQIEFPGGNEIVQSARSPNDDIDLEKIQTDHSINWKRWSEKS